MQRIKRDYLALKKEIWYVYLAMCSDGTFYTGITTDPERRIAEHNHSDAKGSRYTRTRRPVRLSYLEQAAGRGPATLREREIKKMGKKDKEKLADNFRERGLS